MVYYVLYIFFLSFNSQQSHLNPFPPNVYIFYRIVYILLKKKRRDREKNSYKRLSVCPHPEKRNHYSFVNISPTSVIGASMERSSRVLQHGNPKI